MFKICKNKFISECTISFQTAMELVQWLCSYKNDVLHLMVVPPSKGDQQQYYSSKHWLAGQEMCSPCLWLSLIWLEQQLLVVGFVQVGAQNEFHKTTFYDNGFSKCQLEARSVWFTPIRGYPPPPALVMFKNKTFWMNGLSCLFCIHSAVYCWALTFPRVECFECFSAAVEMQKIVSWQSGCRYSEEGRERNELLFQWFFFSLIIFWSSSSFFAARKVFIRSRKMLVVLSKALRLLTKSSEMEGKGGDLRLVFQTTRQNLSST